MNVAEKLNEMIERANNLWSEHFINDNMFISIGLFYDPIESFNKAWFVVIDASGRPGLLKDLCCGFNSNYIAEGRDIAATLNDLDHNFLAIEECKKKEKNDFTKWAEFDPDQWNVEKCIIAAGPIYQIKSSFKPSRLVLINDFPSEYILGVQVFIKPKNTSGYLTTITNVTTHKSIYNEKELAVKEFCTLLPTNTWMK